MRALGALDPGTSPAARAWVLAAALPAAGSALVALGLAQSLPFLLLVAPPFVTAALRARLGARARAWSASVGLALQLLLALAIGMQPSGSLQLVFWALALSQALAYARSGGGAALSAVCALALSVAALGVSPSHLSFATPFVVSVLALPGLVLLQAESARRAVRRNPALAAHMQGAAIDRRGRALFGLRVAAWCLAGVFVLLAASTRLAGAAGKLLAREAPSGPRDEELADAAADAAGGPTDPARWKDRLSFGEGVGRLSEEVVLWAAPRSEPGGPLLLNVVYMDTFDERGLGNPRLGEGQRYLDADDGRSDGWIEFDAGGSSEALELDVLQRPLHIDAVGGDALVRLEPLRALRVDEAFYSRDGALVLPGARDEFFSYRLRVAHPGDLPAAPVAARARHSDARFTALPVDSAGLQKVTELAAQLGGGAADDSERVRRVLAFFSSEFRYSLEGAGFVGVAGAAAFLEERVGYCTTFAAASVLLLRSQGLACRAVGGYLASEWQPERGAFVVRGRHAHAWIEVHFEGVGWRAFDPTPARERERAFERRDSAFVPDPGEWSGALIGALRDAALGRGPDGRFRRLAARLAEGPAVLREGLRALSPLERGLVLVLVVALAGALAARLLRRPGRARSGVLGQWLAPRAGPYQRLLDALQRGGWSPAAAESLRAFARRVEEARVLEGFGHATEIHLAERFGAARVTSDEQAFLDRLLGIVRGGPAPAIGGEA